jgi:hypothetical protein
MCIWRDPIRGIGRESGTLGTEEPIMSKHVVISPNEAADRLAIREFVEAYAHCADRRDAKGQIGELTITIKIADVDGGTDLDAVHEGLPPGVSPADNELGWRLSLAKLAALVEAGSRR